MRIALLTDLHFGVRDDSSIFLNHQRKFFDEIFFPYLEENGIRTIIDLGDTFDKRKSINYSTLKHIKEFYFDKIEKGNMDLHIVVGNHTLYYRHSNEVNSYDSLFADSQSVNIISEPQELELDGVKMLLLPWINKQNEKACLECINTTDAAYLLGHFEVTGVKLHRNWEFHSGTDYDLLKKFKGVWSGHYHLRLVKDNFRYLGTPYQMDWTDLYEKKGFYIFDTDTHELSFIENPHKLFKKIVYTGEDTDADVSGCFIKVILKEQLKDYTKFDLYIKNLEEKNHKVSVDEQFVDAVKRATIDEMIDVQDTFEFLERAIENIDNIDHQGLRDIMKSLYEEAKEQQKS